MSFIVFKVSDYDYTAEREQYRTVCQALRKKYERSEELCLFIANYNIFDCELDGIIIKSDAIIAVEFKNFGGNVIAVENGQWMLDDGTVIKGGSHKSVYQQAKVNHIAIKRGLKEGGILPPKMTKNIPTLIIFAKPICVQNKLSEKVKSWLHISGINCFIEKVEDITSANFYLSNEQILGLIPKLGLLKEFVDSRFSTDIDSVSYRDSKTEFSVEINKSIPTAKLLDVNLKSKSEVLCADPNSIKMAYHNFIVSKVLPTVGIMNNDYKLLVVEYCDFVRIMEMYPPFKSEYVAILQMSDMERYSMLLHRIFSKEVVSLASDVICWGEGEFAYSETQKATNLVVKKNSERNSINHQFKDTIFHCELPKWLDNYIFGDLNAKYKPNYDRFSFNLNHDKDECKIYMGTYFPRSFAEGYLVFDTILHDEFIANLIESKDTIKILDFGCGSGGEIFGLLHALENHTSKHINVRIVGIDGNHNALRLLESVAKKYNARNIHHIDVLVAPCNIKSISELSEISSIVGLDFDFVITSKAIGELEYKNCCAENGYEIFANIFAPLLGDTGIMLILDVTIKNERTGMFLPQLMNIGINRFLSQHSLEYKSLASCAGKSKTGYCERKCFYKKEVLVSHSAKSNDVSKIAVRIIARQGLPIGNSVFKNILNNFECIYR